MNGTLIVVTIVGTRPEIIRLSRIIPKLDNNFTHFLVHTGQNYDYELSEIFFDSMNLRKPDYFLESCSDSSNLGTSIAKIIESSYNILFKIKPDALLVLGDTNSCLSAYAAKRLHIPIFHLEAGNRCFDYRVPEELNRKIVDSIADINLTYSDISRNYLLKENFPPEQIIKVGSPMLEVINFYKEKINKSSILKKLNITKGNYFVISVHREENVENKDNLLKLASILDYLLTINKNVIFSMHPRTQKKLDFFKIKINKKIIIKKPFNYIDFLCLQKNSLITLSDSGTINEESNLLGFNALNLRMTHERPEAIEEGGVIMVGLNKDAVAQSIRILLNIKTKNNQVKDYSTENVSDKVIKVIQSYTPYINEKIWKKK